MKKIGIIKGISPKPEGRNAFTLKGEQIKGEDVWFWGFSVNAIVGDEVEFELTRNGDFNNFSDLKVLRSAEELKAKPSETPETPAQKLSNEKIAISLTTAIIAQKHDNIITIDGAVETYKAALNKLNK